jgi:hypothetical protein
MAELLLAYQANEMAPRVLERWTVIESEVLNEASRFDEEVITMKLSERAEDAIAACDISLENELSIGGWVPRDVPSTEAERSDTVILSPGSKTTMLGIKTVLETWVVDCVKTGVTQVLHIVTCPFVVELATTV